MRDLEVAEIRVAMSGEAPVVVMREVRGDRLLPIWMSAGGAAAIVSATQEPDEHRPYIHDLFVRMLAAIDATVREVRITDHIDGQFFAEIDLGERVVAARPSDAIALALRIGCPIRCGKEVLAEAGIVVTPPDEVERFRAFLDEVSPDDF